MIISKIKAGQFVSRFYLISAVFKIMTHTTGMHLSSEIMNTQMLRLK